jgi:hypothetical protein
LLKRTADEPKIVVLGGKDEKYKNVLGQLPILRKP